jgi:hypothetical protein
VNNPQQSKKMDIKSGSPKLQNRIGHDHGDFLPAIPGIIVLPNSAAFAKQFSL